MDLHRKNKQKSIVAANRRVGCSQSVRRVEALIVARRLVSSNQGGESMQVGETIKLSLLGSYFRKR